MRTTFAAIICFLFLGSPSPGAPQAAEIPGSRYAFGNWQGAAYTDDVTQQFSHCAVTAPYRSGDSLFFSINSDVTVSIAVANASWALNPGATFPVAVHVDQRPPFYGTAEAMQTDFAVLRIPEFQRALAAIQKGYTMVIVADGWRGTYDLTGTFRALERAKECVMAFLDYPSTAARQPGGGRSQPTAEAAPAAPINNAGSTDASAAVDPAVLYQLATVMITEAGASDFAYLTEEEKASIGVLPDAVFWTSDSQGLVGGVSASRVGWGVDLSALGVADFQSMAQECPGDVATTSRAVAEASVPGREVRAVCSAGEGSYEVYLTKTLVDDVLLEVLLYFQGNASTSEPANRDLSESVRLRTASFVAEALN